MTSDLLTDLRAVAREHADGLRSTALELDRDPSRAVTLLDRGLPWRQLIGLPAAYNPDPLRVRGRPVYLDSCAQQVVVLEELARADAGAVLALPGPSMSGFVVTELADGDQLDRYWRTVATGATWTFFGMTEPAHGSDPGSMGTTLRPTGEADGLLLTGVKRFVGNGARARIGVVFARRHAGPLGVVAVLVDTDRPGFTAVPLPTLGLRGLQLSELRMTEVPIAGADLLGRHRSATRQGMWAATRTFNRYRPVVSGLALGVAQAGYDLVVAARHRFRSDERHLLADWARRLTGTRALVLAAAHAADRDPGDGTLASAAKIRATRLAEEITTSAVRLLGPGARWEHPLLDKLVRDARAFEFMEGTGNIQRLNLAQGYLQGRLGDARVA
ncbi:MULTISPECIES: acyl-CoA dehydrogenase family protein [Micromonospora]|uniref:Acyl-CoA dehydrogenase n=1 Tax=Micromonospora yangpuensis TaxID=683228 RepID=A0A1C6UNW3_9ACTN|nr:acyl-CoA dehydrogenase family protein [Micromonospora yangpuensis]GGM08925.1 acyl-CoA dehydrogenase [Micromonospora yangpuensis]SCL55715.1 Acyl-CoA dehydrogenase [Micromonospora yangpuensis]